jgi:hypothetical protein
MVKKGLTQTERLMAFKHDLQARRAREPWFVMAGRIEAALAEGTAIGYGEDVIKNVVVETSKLSWGVVTRYLSTIRRVKAAAAAAGLETEALLSPGFNGVEAAVRLYDRSASEGLDALVGLREGRLSAGDVSDKLALRDLKETESSRGMRLRRRGTAIDGVEKALAKESGRLFPKDSTVKRRPALRYFRRVGMEVRREDGTCVCGLDIMASDAGTAADELDEGLSKVVLLSTYFPRFFLVFSADYPAAAVDEAMGALDLIGVRWLGVMKVTPEGTVETLRKPVGAPAPDRSAEYERLRAGFAYGRRSIGDLA